MYGYRMYENGAVNRYGNFDVEDPALYQTDVLREKAVASIEGTAPGTPLFLSLMFVAPHGESVDPGSTTEPFIRAAPRDVGRYRHLRLPRSAHGERDVRDKPPYVRKLHRASSATAARIRADFRSRRESLIAVDEAVEAVVERAGAHRAARLDLHPLHLGQRLLPGRAQHLQGQVPRLRPVLARAAADPRPRHPGRHGVGRARHQRRPRADDPRGRGRHRRPADGRALDAPVRPRRAPAHAPAGPARGARGGRHRPRRRRAQRHASASTTRSAPRATSTSSGSTARASSTTGRATRARCARATATAATAASAAPCTASSCACATAPATSAASRSGRSAAETATHGPEICWRLRRCRDSFSGPSS